MSRAELRRTLSISNHLIVNVNGIVCNVSSHGEKFGLGMRLFGHVFEDLFPSSIVKANDIALC